MKNLLIEGWRGMNHSFALVNQHQLLHLSKNNNFNLFHRDVPPANPAWSHSGTGFNQSDQEIIGSIAAPSTTLPKYDCLYRISYPYKTVPGQSEQLLLFANSEFGTGPLLEAFDVQDKRLILRPGLKIVTPSAWSKVGFVTFGFDPQDVYVVPHGVEPGQFSHASSDEKAAIREHLNLPQDAFVFLNVSAMTWNKGIAPLLIAFAMHRAKYPNALLLLKGADYLYGSQIESAVKEVMAQRPGLLNEQINKSIVYIYNNVSNEELANLYRASDVYVSPYRAEGFNIPALEAAACGLPVIATAGGSTDDFCRDNFCLKIQSRLEHAQRFGTYLEPELDSLIDLMAMITDNSAFRQLASTAGPEWVRTRYSWSAVTDQLATLMTSA